MLRRRALARPPGPLLSLISHSWTLKRKGLLRARPVTKSGDQLILLTGASGYIGGRLLHGLESPGRPVRCLTRRPEILQGRVGPPTKVVEGDLLDRTSLNAAFEGVQIAYYLVHSMGGSR